MFFAGNDDDDGNDWNRYQFYALRHENYFEPVHFGDDVLRFYDNVATWEQETDMDEKWLLFQDLMVTAFRLEARTKAFLRKRMRDDGTVRYV